MARKMFNELIKWRMVGIKTGDQYQGSIMSYHFANRKENTHRSGKEGLLYGSSLHFNKTGFDWKKENISYAVKQLNSNL